MREFFKGWRRNLGVLTLILACVVTAWWIKSLFSPTLPYRLQIDFEPQGLRVAIQEVEFAAFTTGSLVTITRTNSWFNRLVVPLPYWSVVIPLTLLSAWLLLSKPRHPCQKKTLELTAIDRRES